uniref:Uncharacterized protein n=1 Tax=Rangifer tarandus platyrhynchus TaxID=3082113 RepID=A0ACB0EVZ8_RANTA|nr:unnamed protein product [Rangifer tarandus platyrhynchus]
MACVLPGQEPVSACGGRAPSAFRDPYGPQSTGAGGAEGAAQPLHPVRDSRQELHNDASILSTFAAPDPPGRRKCRSRGVTHRPPHTEWAPMYVPPAPRAPPAVPGPLVPQTRTPRLHILGPTGFLIQKPRQLATQIGSPHPFRFLRALSVWVWVSQTSSGASVCSHRDPCADHGLPASVSPASFHRGLPPALGTGHTAISLPRLSPGCRVSEAVDPVPLQCPHVHPPQGSQGHASDSYRDFCEVASFMDVPVTGQVSMGLLPDQMPRSLAAAHSLVKTQMSGLSLPSGPSPSRPASRTAGASRLDARLSCLRLSQSRAVQTRCGCRPHTEPLSVGQGKAASRTEPEEHHSQQPLPRAGEVPSDQAFSDHFQLQEKQGRDARLNRHQHVTSRTWDLGSADPK